MAKFNEYPSKTTPEDADTLMLYDAATKSNKLSPFSGIWNWMVNKLTNAVISNLQTNNKTVLGAINELNSNPKAQFGTTANIEIEINSIQTIDVTFEKAFKSVPTVLCSIRSGTTNPVYGSLNAFVDYSSVTKTGFTVKIANSATSGAVLRPAVSWIAIAQIFATPVQLTKDFEKFINMFHEIMKGADKYGN